MRVIFEPWNYEVGVRSIFLLWRYINRNSRVGAATAIDLERLIPVARKFTVHLLGTGLPSFYVADLNDLSFTLVYRAG